MVDNLSSEFNELRGKFLAFCQMAGIRTYKGKDPSEWISDEFYNLHTTTCLSMGQVSEKIWNDVMMGR